MTVFVVVNRLLARVRQARVLGLLIALVVVILVGAGAFAIAEHLSYGTGIYWAITTASTVGYGDVTPKNALGRAIASVVMLTAIPLLGAVFALIAGATVVNHLRRLFGMDAHRLPSGSFTVVVGDHPITARVGEELAASGIPVVVVSTSAPAAGRAREGIETVTGDPGDESVLRRARLGEASRALLAFTDDAEALMTAVALHAVAPDLEIYALAEAANVGRALTELGIRHVVSSSELLAHTLVKTLETPIAVGLLRALVDSDSFVLRERTVSADLAGQLLSAARSATDGLVLGVVRGRRVDLGVGEDPRLEEGDRLVELVRRPDA